MGKACENLPFGSEALAEQLRCERHVDDLDCDLLIELPVIAMSQVDRSHAAAAHQPVDGIRAHTGEGQRLAPCNSQLLVGLLGLTG